MLHAVARHGRLRALTDLEADAGLELAAGAQVVAETGGGLQLARVLAVGPADPGRPPRGRVVRAASPEDLGRAAAREAEARGDLERAAPIARGYGARLLLAERPLEPVRAVLHYEATARVDVPGLLAAAEAALGAPVELNQLGARQRARACGGAGVCGRALCCATFLRALEPVSLRATRLQGVAHTPEATAGACGRLKCCLRFEAPVYEQEGRDLPRLGWRVRARRAEGVVVAVEPLRRRVLVRPADGRPDVALFADELEHAAPPPRAPLPLAGEPAGAGPPAGPAERGWADLARRLLRRVTPARLVRPPAGPDAPDADAPQGPDPGPPAAGPPAAPG